MKCGLFFVFNAAAVGFGFWDCNGLAGEDFRKSGVDVVVRLFDVGDVGRFDVVGSSLINDGSVFVNDEHVRRGFGAVLPV